MLRHAFQGGKPRLFSYTGVVHQNFCLCMPAPNSLALWHALGQLLSFFDKLLRRRLSREEPASKGAGCGANPPLQEDLSGRHLLRSYVRGPTYIGGVLSGGESIWAELASKPTFTQLYDSTHRP